jgi:phosphoglycerate dehydrogenase-like enzyme
MQPSSARDATANGPVEREPRAFLVGITRDLRDETGEPIFDIGLDALAGAPGVAWEFLPSLEDELAPDTIAPYDALVVFSPAVSAATVGASPRLTLVARLGVGYDRVDLDACSARGVLVTNTPRGVRRPMATSAIAYVLALAHRMLIKDQIARRRDWEAKWRHVGLGLRGRTLGIVGFGGIGQDLVGLAAPFGLVCIATDPFVSDAAAAELGVRLVDLEELLRTSDFVCLSCPLTDETRHLINQERLGLMRPEAYLINVARGPIVDHAALTAALIHGRIAGAALDVFEPEPPAADDPLLALDTVILAPHAIGHTDELFRDCGRSAFESALAVSAGQVPEHVVNPDVLKSAALAEKLARHKPPAVTR